MYCFFVRSERGREAFIIFADFEKLKWSVLFLCLDVSKAVHKMGISLWRSISSILFLKGNTLDCTRKNRDFLFS